MKPEAGATTRVPSTPAADTTPDRTPDTVPFSDLAHAAYCPRQLYYARRSDRSVPEDVTQRVDLAFRYPALRDASAAELREAPVEPDPEAYRARLDALADRALWPDLIDPAERRAFLAGKDCHGLVHKLVAGDPPTPVLVSPGEPAEHGVWEPQAVRAVAAAKALAWEREREIPRAVVEYPAHGVVRTVRLTVRKTAAYRRALRAARRVDDPPPRLSDTSKCDPCPFREECGVATTSLRSLLGL